MGGGDKPWTSMPGWFKQHGYFVHGMGPSHNIHVWIVSPTHFSLEDILVLAGTAATGRMAPPTSTRISARLNNAGNTVYP